jgi:outer membrane receptor protein involved in Fe transport
MNKKNVTASRFAGTAAWAALAIALAAPAQAQEAAAAADATETADASAPVEEIVVTGSRIARPDLTGATPTAVIGETQIAQEGATNIQDVLNELPQAGIGIGRTNSNFLTTGNGVASVNLRNLGSSRTLVLVNGRRFVAGLAGTSIVDLNNIPTDLVERVEVVTGGASAVYGSEAIAGVVNFIMKDDFEGISARGQVGLSEHGDNARYSAGITGGTTWGADDRGNAMISFSWDKDEGLLSRKRRISSEDCFLLACGPEAYSSFAPQGRFQLLDAAGRPFGGTGGNPATFVTGAPVSSGGIFSFDRNNNNALTAGFPADFGYNRNNDRRISTPVERYLVSSILNYDLSDSAEVFFEGTYAKTKSSSRLEPLAIETPDLYTDTATQGFGIPATNPYIPASVRSLIEARNSDADPSNDVGAIAFRRRQNDVFDRSNVNDRDTFRVATGVRGEIKDWKYEVAYTFGQLKDTTLSEDLDNRRYREALDAVQLADGTIVCRSLEARAAGCVPINVFGAGTVSPEAAAYVQAPVARENNVSNTQHVITANLSGSLLELPAGPLGFAVGAEYRKEKSVDNWDVLTNTGGNAGNLTPDTRGSFNVKETYVEVNVPVLADRPFVNYFGLTGAARYSDYSTVGSVFSWNAGAEWSPIEDVRLRGVYAVANRAPNIGELFTAASETFPSVVDPCDGVTATSTGDFAAACRAIPGVAQAIAAGGVFEYTQADIQTINGFNSGNRNLDEETAKTLTLGAVVTPKAVPGLSLTVDYFNIKVDDAIGTVPRDASIEGCLATGLAEFCNNVIRSSATGLITTVNAPLQNIASFETSGVDLNVRYGRELGLLRADDRLDVNLLYTYLIKLNQTPLIGADELKERGQLGGGERLGAGFKHKASARLGYSTGPITASWQVNYLGKIKAERDFNAADLSDDAAEQAQLNDINEVGDRFYHDVQLRYAVGEDRRFEFFGGIDNLLDKKPPFIPAPFTPNVTGTETAADVYDPFGRRFYVGAQVRF